jgi:hypothetical protein
VSNSLDFHFDTIRPTVALTSNADTLSTGAPLVIRTADYPIPITTVFDQAAAAFVLANVNVANGAVTAFVDSGDSVTFTFGIQATAQVGGVAPGVGT